ncbi:DUF1259 domain-containing protein [Paenibacillus sp. SAF-054]|uniref:DUF1259 domain-containing protein n=1 Tax=unclassified Paenibacillus TaxID=185978 RepID=UPI003F811DC0
MRKTVFLLWIFGLLLMPAGVTHGDGVSSNVCKPLVKIFKKDVKEESGICKVEIMRKNIPVTNLGVAMLPETIELGFGANFQKAGDRTVVIGEFALLGNEVNRVIDVLRKGNIEISAVHNHQIGEKPPIIYMHFQGIGSMDALGMTVQEAIKAAEQG